MLGNICYSFMEEFITDIFNDLFEFILSVSRRMLSDLLLNIYGIFLIFHLRSSWSLIPRWK